MKHKSKQNLTQFTGAVSLIIAVLFFSGCGCSEEAVQNDNQSINNELETGEYKMTKEIVRYAAMAPSGHNTQPWKFFITEDTIVIKPDYSRRLPAVDPDDRELFISLGCALENLVVAAEHFGHDVEIEYNLSKEYEEEIIVVIKRGNVIENSLFEQLTFRQTTRNEYNGKSVPEAEQDSITDFIRNDYVQNKIITDTSAIKKIIELVKEGNTLQFADDNFMDELKFWIRFSESEAEEKRDGLPSNTSGNPSVPRWIGKIVMDLFYSAKDQNEKDEKFIKSSAGIILFHSSRNDKRAWIESGRVYERFSLLTTKMNIKCAFINQPVELVELNKPLLNAMEVRGGYPQMLLRFGYSDAMPKSPRRKLEDMIICK